MGNLCPSPRGHSQIPRSGSQRPAENDSSNNADSLDFNVFLSQMKEYHLNRMKKELEKNDIHQFILDNLLMCIQFFDNFEKAADTANEFKRSTEREMTELLAKDPHEGMILGDRRIKLLTGMTHVLAQNYIYRGKNHSDEDDEIDLLYGGIGLKDAFMTEGILPLEFIISWDNIEVYEQNEDVKHYSDAKGASPSARFVLEQPDKRIEFPQGFMRVKCVDEPTSHRKQLEIPAPLNSDFGYAQEPLYSKVYSDAVSEANSESDGPTPHSGSTSDDDDVMKLSGILKGLPSNNVIPPFDIGDAPSTSMAARQAWAQAAGSSKPGFSKLRIPQPNTHKTESFPSLVVHAATPPVLDGQFHSKPFENGFLFPNSRPHRISNQHSKSTPSLSANLDRDSPGKETTSSGYDTTSTRSRSSSMASEMLRDSWQKKNIKRLWEYGKKSRKDQIPKCGRYDPIPSDCYSEIKIEYQYDLAEEDEDEEAEDSESGDEDEDTDGLEIDFNSGTLKKSKTQKNVEDDYQMRFYLNSLQFSSNACSEFHYIGPILSIPEASLEQGVVLGTTIRCPIPYTYPKESENEDDSAVGSYYVPYSFTPALHSKSWPTPLYLQFNLSALHQNTHGEVPWPSLAQMGKIEMSGCNAIPIGYRPINGFVNVEQILEWELNFHECEINLLDSFRGPHWRAYIYASLLMRAFIAPLGPLGIGLEHIRNIMYFMCNEDFYGWNDEQPGLHLSKLLGRLYDCLSRNSMSSFFVRSRNLLQSIPQHNLRFVQAHLKQICDNIIVYCIYAFRNLMNVKKEQAYPLPNFKDLYDLLTCPEGKLIEIANPCLKLQRDREDEQKREMDRQKQRSKKKKPPRQNLLAQQEEIDKSFFASQRERLNQPPKRDKVQKKLRDEYKRRMEEQRVKELKDRETRKLQQDPEHRLPDAERRQSIDLKKSPVIQSRFTKLRLCLVIKFFIEQFLKMARRATELQNYGQATMYVHQVENLCEIVKAEENNNVAINLTDEDLDKWRKETLELWGKIGNDKDQYILARISGQSSSHYSQLTPARSLNDLASGSGLPSFTSNWDLRKLPTPPPSEKGILPTGKKFEKPNIASSLQSFENLPKSRIPSEASIPTPVSPRLPPSERVKPRRQESIKFVSAVLPKDIVPPATPPRSSSRPPSRQSTIDLALDHHDEALESTDL